MSKRLFEAFFLTLTFLLPWTPFFSPRAPGLFVPLLAATLIIGHFAGGTHIRFPTRNAWLLLGGFLGVAALSLLWATDPDATFDRWQKLVVMLPALMVLVFGISQSSVPRHTTGVFLSGCGVAIAFLVFHILSGGTLHAWMNPEAGYYVNLASANRPAVILLLLLTPALLALRSLGKENWVWVTAVAVVLLLSQTSSQSAVGGGVIWLIIYFLTRYLPRTGKYASLYGGSAFILILPVLILGFEHYDSARTIEMPEASIGARLDVWYAVSHKIFESPLYGFGLEAARSITSWATEFVYFRGPQIHHPHNGVLQIWLELGLIGAGFAIALWVAVIRSASNCNSHLVPLLFVAAGSGLFVLAVSHGLWQSWWISAVAASIAYTKLFAEARPAPSAG